MIKEGGLYIRGRFVEILQDRNVFLYYSLTSNCFKIFMRLHLA